MLAGGIYTLDDFQIEGKTVLLRVDINCTVDVDTKAITNDIRIKRVIPTIKELIEKKAKLVILAHQGDPMDYQNYTTLEEHAVRLSKYLRKKVQFIDDVAGPAARTKIQKLKPGKAILLDNVRLHTEETIVFEKQIALSPEEQAQTVIVRKLAPLADLYLCDAFAAVHRSEPTLVGFQEHLPSGCGRLFEQEYGNLSIVRDNPKHPSVFILGGAKILDAFNMMGTVLQNGTADTVLAVGFVGQVMLLAQGIDLGEPSMEIIRKKQLDEFIPVAKKLLEEHPGKILVPQDVAVEQDGQRKEVRINKLPADYPIFDIGSKTIKMYSEQIDSAQTCFMNGPAGFYEDERFADGTKKIWSKVGRSNAYSVIGGGDTIAAARKFKVEKKISYICTAGGGMVLFMSGKELPVATALQKAAKKFPQS